MIDQATLQAKFSEIRPLLNERQLRLVALAEAKSLGHGGIKAVAEACGLSRRSIERAKVEANRENTAWLHKTGGDFGAPQVKEFSCPS